VCSITEAGSKIIVIIGAVLKYDVAGIKYPGAMK